MVQIIVNWEWPQTYILRQILNHVKLEAQHYSQPRHWLLILGNIIYGNILKMGTCNISTLCGQMFVDTWPSHANMLFENPKSDLAFPLLL